MMISKVIQQKVTSKDQATPLSLYRFPFFQADLEDPILNPSLWPPSNLVHWGEGLVLPALAVAALVANLVLLRFMMDHICKFGSYS